jgi:hypothetical protein
MLILPSKEFLSASLRAKGITSGEAGRAAKFTPGGRMATGRFFTRQLDPTVLSNTHKGYRQWFGLMQNVKRS